MEFVIWDKASSIKGYDANYWINEYKVEDNDEVILFLKNNIVERFEKVTTLQRVFNIDANFTAEQTAKEYLRIIEAEKNKRNQEVNVLENLKESNANLLKDSANKAIEINNLKKHNATMLIDNANKTTQINNLNKSLATVTLELAKLKAQK